MNIRAMTFAAFLALQAVGCAHQQAIPDGTASAPASDPAPVSGSCRLDSDCGGCPAACVNSACTVTAQNCPQTVGGATPPAGRIP